MDPQFPKNDKDLPDIEYTLATTSDEVEIDASMLCCIRRVRQQFSGTGPWRVKIYEDAAKTKLMYDSMSRDGSVTDFEDPTPRVFANRDVASLFYATLTGQVGDKITLGFSILDLQ